MLGSYIVAVYTLAYELVQFKLLLRRMVFHLLTSPNVIAPAHLERHSVCVRRCACPSVRQHLLGELGVAMFSLLKLHIVALRTFSSLSEIVSEKMYNYFHVSLLHILSACRQLLETSRLDAFERYKSSHYIQI